MIGFERDFSFGVGKRHLFHAACDLPVAWARVIFLHEIAVSVKIQVKNRHAVLEAEMRRVNGVVNPSANALELFKVHPAFLPILPVAGLRPYAFLQTLTHLFRNTVADL